MQAEKRMVRLTDPILAEMDQEAEVTTRLFNVIPEDKLGWRPHPKAKTLGALAMHIATIPGTVAELGDLDVKEAGTFPSDVEPASRTQIIEAFAESLKRAKKIVSATGDTRAVAEWKLVKDGRTLFAAPRIGFWRSILLNHNYHHRGQLSAYLRELGVPLPSIYGPSADENPFA
jgi:uncharacterized damage-inducible protein DinB